VVDAADFDSMIDLVDDVCERSRWQFFSELGAEFFDGGTLLGWIFNLHRGYVTLAHGGLKWFGGVVITLRAVAAVEVDLHSISLGCESLDNIVCRVSVLVGDGAAG
jgi:hypothetical protein